LLGLVEIAGYEWSYALLVVQAIVVPHVRNTLYFWQKVRAL